MEKFRCRSFIKDGSFEELRQDHLKKYSVERGPYFPPLLKKRPVVPEKVDGEEYSFPAMLMNKVTRRCISSLILSDNASRIYSGPDILEKGRDFNAEELASKLEQVHISPAEENESFPSSEFMDASNNIEATSISPFCSPGFKPLTFDTFSEKGENINYNNNNTIKKSPTWQNEYPFDANPKTFKLEDNIMEISRPSGKRCSSCIGALPFDSANAGDDIIYELEIKNSFRYKEKIKLVTVGSNRNKPYSLRRPPAFAFHQR